MMSGHRRALLITMALSIENESLGKPSIVQSRIFTGSPRTEMSLKALVHGIFFSSHSFTHCVNTSSRYGSVNAPKYAMYPEQSNTSPVRFV